MSTAGWVQGHHHGLVWPHGMALLDGDVDLDVVQLLWRELRQDADLATFLELLTSGTGAGILALPSFVIVLDGPERSVHTAVRGQFQLSVVTGVGTETVTGVGVTTWSERFIEDVIELRAGDMDESGVGSRSIISGVVPAAGMRRPFGGDAANLPAAVRTPSMAAEPELGPEPEPEPAQVQTPNPPVSVPDPVVKGADLHTLREEDLDDSVDVEPSPAEAAARSIPRAMPDAAGPSVDDGVEEIAEQPSLDLPDDGFTDLWNETVLHPVEAAAVRHEEADGAPSFISAVPAPASGSVPGPLSEPASAGAPQDDPWAVADHDGMTVMQFDVSGARAPASTPRPAASEGSSVLAVACPVGHANPPARATCWQCGQMLVADAVRVRRPSVGVVRTSTGETFDLDTPIVFGRNPRASKITGTTMPRLVPLPYPHISGTHLRLDIDGWSVLAVDQGSRNGTFLLRAGNPPTRLPESRQLLIDGDVLDLGHGVRLTMERLA